MVVAFADAVVCAEAQARLSEGSVTDVR
jgi:hypothetical protein